MGKKVVSLVLALSMVFSLSVSAFANADDELLDSSVLTENVETFMDKKNEEEVVFDVSETLSEKELNENFDKDKIENVVTDSLSDKNFTYDVNSDAEIKVSDTISFDTNTIENNIMIMNLAAQVNEEPAYALLYNNGTLVFQRGYDSNNDPNIENYGTLKLGPFEVDETKIVAPLPWRSCSYYTTKVVFKDVIHPVSTQNWFNCYEYLTQIENIENLDTTNVTTMLGMFYQCKKLKSLDLSSFNTSNVTTMFGMFYRCTSLTYINLDNWDTSNVTAMDKMFEQCTSLGELDLSHFNVQNVRSMQCMFNLSLFSRLDLSNWNFSSLETPVTGHNQPFNCYTSVSTSVNSKVFRENGILIAKNWILPKSCYQFFCQLTNLTYLDTEGWNSDNTTNMNSMFENCKDLKTLDLSMLNTSNVIDMNFTFSGISALETLNLSNWNTEKVLGMYAMFHALSNLKEIKGLEGFDTSNVVNMTHMFHGNKSLTSLNLSSFKVNIEDALYFTRYCSNVKYLDFSGFNFTNAKDCRMLLDFCYKLESFTTGPLWSTHYTDDGTKTFTVPTPDPQYIPGATGKWYSKGPDELWNTEDDLEFLPTEIPDLIADTYYAVKPTSYTVAIDENGGIPIDDLSIEENGKIPPLMTTKPGYILDSWLKTDGTAWDFDKDVVTSNIMLTAKWTPAVAQYKVKHYLQSLDDEYILWQTDIKESVTESKVHADPKNYGNFHYSEDNILNVQDGTVVGDGSLILSIYYDRDIYTVEFEADSVEAEVIDDQFVMYEDTAEDPGDPLHLGYTMMGWRVTKMEYVAPGEPEESSPNTRMRKTKAAMLRVPSNEDLYDFSTPVVGNMELTAVWVANGDTKYKVEHWIWDKDSNQYILKETENLMALTDAEVYAQPKVYEGMHEVYDAEGRINHGTVIGNGSLVLRLYYDFNEYGVTINPNNGDDATEISAIYGEKLEEPSVPYREGFVFNGWYISNDNTKPYDFSIPVTHDFTLVASWVIPDTETPVVEIKNPEDKPASYAKVSIKQGNTIYKEGITDGEGKFSLKDIPDGYYNLVIEHENIVKTPIIEVSKDTENIEVHLRAETINSLLNVNEGTKDVVVGGLTTIYSNENLYTEEDKQLVSEGNIVAYSMNVKTATQEEIEERSPDLILAANIDNKEISGYLKMDLTKYRATSDGEILSTEILPDLYGHLLEIHVPLREDQQGKEGYIVYRMHEGQVYEITETPNENGAYMTLIDGNNNGEIDELVVYASKFSDYCLAYDKPKYIVTINYDNGLESSVYSVTEDTKIVKPENPIKDGYTFSKWVIKDTEIEFDFETVITEDIEIVAIYTKNTVIDPQPTYNDDDGPYRPFTDVKHKDLFYKEVYEAYDKKLVEGESHNKFNPNGNMDRASTAHIFYQLNKVKNFKYKDVFKDVKESTKYAKDIIWANENNVMIGYGNPWFGNFGPNDSLTREQFALVLYRVYHKDSDKYDWDESMLEEAEKVSEWAREAMCWCVGKGMIKGNENGDLMPQKAVSRAEVCAIVIRFVKENNKK